MSRIESLAPNEVLVFGSNASGAHGGGAARFAYDRFGAVWGQSEGLQDEVRAFFAGAPDNVVLPESFLT